MKKIILTSIVLLGWFFAFSQTEGQDSIPVYRRFPTVPPFTLMLAPDSAKFVKDDLKRKKPVVMVFFSPDCGHCKTFVQDLLAHYSLVKKAQIVMASSLNFDLIKKYYEETHIENYPSIKMGRDGAYFLGTFYSVRNFPSVFIYDKKGNFVKGYDGNVTAVEIAGQLRN